MEQENLGRDFLGAVLVFDGQEVQRALVAAGAVFAGDVVPELVGADLGEEIAAMVEGLGVEELRLDGGVDALDLGVGVGTGGRIKAVPGSRGYQSPLDLLAVKNQDRPKKISPKIFLLHPIALESLLPKTRGHDVPRPFRNAVRTAEWAQ